MLRRNVTQAKLHESISSRGEQSTGYQRRVTRCSFPGARNRAMPDVRQRSLPLGSNSSCFRYFPIVKRQRLKSTIFCLVERLSHSAMNISDRWRTESPQFGRPPKCLPSDINVQSMCSYLKRKCLDGADLRATICPRATSKLTFTTAPGSVGY